MGFYKLDPQADFPAHAPGKVVCIAAADGGIGVSHYHPKRPGDLCRLKLGRDLYSCTRSDAATILRTIRKQRRAKR